MDKQMGTVRYKTRVLTLSLWNVLYFIILLPLKNRKYPPEVKLYRGDVGFI